MGKNFKLAEGLLLLALLPSPGLAYNFITEKYQVKIEAISYLCKL
jgi:hypothetical protein